MTDYANPHLYTRLGWAMERMNPVTSNPVCLTMAGMILREAKRTGEYDAVLADLMARRRAWRTRQFHTQRRWQRETRRATRARHHDSIEIREKYVRARG